jgi:hypothetical protein
MTFDILAAFGVNAEEHPEEAKHLISLLDHLSDEDKRILNDDGEIFGDHEALSLTLADLEHQALVSQAIAYRNDAERELQIPAGGNLDSEQWLEFFRLYRRRIVDTDFWLRDPEFIEFFGWEDVDWDMLDELNENEDDQIRDDEWHAMVEAEAERMK